MKIVYFTLPSIVFLIIIIILRSFGFDKKSEINSEPCFFLESAGQVHDKYLFGSDGRLIFTLNDSNYYSFKIYNKGKIEDFMPHKKNVFNPILISNEISGIQDSDGDEEFKSLSAALIEYIGSNSIKAIYSFKLGLLILLQVENDNGLYLINLSEKTKRRIAEITYKLNGAIFSKTGNTLIVSYDGSLICIDLLTNDVFELANCLEGEKLNPFLFDSNLYFVNNSQSEYYNLFKIDLNDSESCKVQLVLELEHDIRLPKIKNDFLYFIEVINSEYLLKKIDLESQKIYSITYCGVVYNYDFYKEGSLTMIYSDLITPKCLMIYNELDKSFLNVSGSSTKHNISKELIKSGSGNSSAYSLKKNGSNIKGVILFFHPGLHSDFSPRWDDVLLNLCYNGYTIIAPNSPMSSGYGKTYYNSSFDQAIEDSKEWKRYILKHYKKMPLFYLSMSSGNILMEYLLNSDTHGIEAAGSLFGIPAEINRRSFFVPTLYILGENDPQIDFNRRYLILSEEQKSHPSLSIIKYDEGHWFRKRDNMRDAVNRIINYFEMYSN